MTMFISIHALREEGDTSFGSLSPISSQFLSTPSARKATVLQGGLKNDGIYFYPRPPRGRRRKRIRWYAKYANISIHALREEGDSIYAPYTYWDLPNFYPRPPRGRRHAGEALRVGGVVISIHALREEGDPKMVGSRKRY